MFSKQHEILLLSFMHSLYISLYRSLDSDSDSNHEHPRKCLQCMMTLLSEQECTYQLKKMFADQGFRMGLSADWRNIQVSESLNPQSPQVTICCYVCAAALVHLRLGRPGPPARSFKVASQAFRIVRWSLIFRRFLFWGIGRWPPDFFDLEPGRKSQAPDVCRPPPGDCSVAARFTLRMTEISADAPTAIGRSSSGDCQGTCRSPSDVKKSGDHRKIAVRASCGHRGIRYRCNLDIDF